MLNYNTQLQSNNADLQMVLQTLQNKAVDKNMENSIIQRTISSYTNDRITYIGSNAF